MSRKHWGAYWTSDCITPLEPRLTVHPRHRPSHAVFDDVGDVPECDAPARPSVAEMRRYYESVGGDVARLTRAGRVSARAIETCDDGPYQRWASTTECVSAIHVGKATLYSALRRTGGWCNGRRYRYVLRDEEVA